MAKFYMTLARIGGLLSLLAAAACSSPPPTSTPTIDLDPVRTEVAATVLAQVTLDMLSTPSITPLPSPTATPASTATPTRPASPSPSPTSTLLAGTPRSGTDQAQWVSQSVADGTAFAPGETFTMTWTLKNVGTSTWTAGYMLRHFTGDTFGAAKEIPLGKEVPPGGTVDFTLQMTAPARGGDYRTDWVMATESRGNFREGVFLKITVAVTPTPTR